MSPQPTAAPAETSAQKQIRRAKELEGQRAKLSKSIAANREYLRLMDANDELDEEQADWLEDFYPQKEKGDRRSEEEIERTRKVKAEARAEVGA
jgi:hypothetical protein